MKMNKFNMFITAVCVLFLINAIIFTKNDRPPFTNPCFTNPRFTNPCFTNPRFTNPRFTNPCFTNPRFTNLCFTKSVFYKSLFYKSVFYKSAFLQIHVLQIRVLQILVLQIRVLQIHLLQIQSVFYESNPVLVLQYAGEMDLVDLFEDCSGYDFDFVDELQEDQVCPICKRAMRDPVQIVECGHQCCEYCLMMSQRYGRFMYKHIHVFPGYKFSTYFC